MPPATRQLTLQLAAFILVLSLAWPIYGLHAGPWPWLPLSLAIGGCAGLLAWLTRQPWWWRLIHCLFVPLAYGAAQLHLPPLVYLGAFMVLMLVYRGAVTGRVPLYFSNAITAQALLTMSAAGQGVFLAIGNGSVLAELLTDAPDASGILICPAGESCANPRWQTLPHPVRPAKLRALLQSLLPAAPTA